MPQPIPLTDLSLGQALRPFEWAAQKAYAASLADLHRYDDYGDYAESIQREISVFLQQELRMKSAGWTGVLSNLICPTVGVSGGFDALITVLARQLTQYTDVLKNNTKPVLLAPVPTYGWFLNTARRAGYTVVKIPRDRNKNWRLDPDDVKSALANIVQSSNLHPTAFFDSNPHQPTGFVRDEDETRELAELFYEFNRDYVAQRTKSASWYGGVPALSVIDDMVYWGTEYGGKKPFSFAAVPEISEHTFLMMGLSKIGLAGLRAGVLVLPYSDFHPTYHAEIKDLLKDRQYFVAHPAVQALGICFSQTAENVTARNDFLRTLARDHKFSGNLMKALINGIEDVAASDADRDNMAAAVSVSRQCSRADAMSLLKQGMDGVRVITSPEAGFFHLLDFEALRGRYFRFPVQPDYKKVGIRLAAGSWTGLKPEDMIFRVSFAFPPNEIVAICGQIEDTCRQFGPAQNTPPGPSPMPG